MTGSRREEFERVALPVASALLRTARRLAHPRHDADDVVQETLLRAYRTFDNFAQGTNGKAWLFTIMHSILANRWRDGRHEPRAIDPVTLDGRFAMAAGDDDAEGLIIARMDAVAEVEAALDQLPAEFKTTVLLVDVEGLTYEEAAGVIGCPIGTVRSRLARARKMLFVSLRDFAQRQGVLQQN